MQYYKIKDGGTSHRNKAVIDWEPSKIKTWGESHIDASHWRPDAEIARATILTGKGSNSQPVYDFPDGKDTGFRPQTRLAGLDIVDVENAIKNIDNSVKASMEEGKQRENTKKMLTEALKDAIQPQRNNTNETQ